MTVKRETVTTVTWTCDRCGNKVRSSQPPDGWRGLFLIMPEADPRNAGARIHLCDMCMNSYEQWLAFPASYPYQSEE